MTEIVWLSTRKAAKLVGVSEYRMYAYVNAGLVTAYRVARMIRYQRDDVLALIEKLRADEKWRAS